MGTEIARPNSPKIQLYAQSLGPQERSKHRAWIGVRVESALRHFWTDTPSDPVKDEIMMDWMKALENFTQDEIRAAFDEHIQRDRRKPTPASVRAILLAHRARHVPEPAPEPEVERVSAEAAREIMEKAGFAPRGGKQ